MKIEKLNIYGFGKHENVIIDFSPGMNVLYGLNEAGKTTIQQFILHVLFGFPQRNNAALRYEPKSGGKYGGQVQLTDELYGQCTVERVRGKSAGDVTVYFGDGTKGGEEELTELLRQYDRASFESIFSFSLIQLQGFEKMDEEELSKTLLASGTTGVDSLLQLEKRMENEMGVIFKKSGRVPKMNVKLKELRELELELQEEQEKVAEYAPSIKRIKEIEAELSLLRKHDSELRKKLQDLTLLRQLLPLQDKKALLESRLIQHGETNFPTDGIRRFESLTSKLIESKAKKQRIKEELTESKNLLPKKHQAQRLSEIELLLAKETEWHGWRSSLASLEDESHRLEGVKHRLLNRLGAQGDEGKTILLNADVSIQKEEEMYELISDLNETRSQINIAESQFSTVEKELAEATSKFGNMTAPTEESLEEASEWPLLRQQLAEAKAYISFTSSSAEKNNKILPMALLLISLAIFGFGLMQQQWILVLAGIIGGGIAVFFYFRKDRNDSSKLKEMESFVSKYAGQEYKMEQLLTQIESYKHEKKRLEDSVTELELKHKALEVKLANLHMENRQAESEFNRFIRGYGFDGLPSLGVVPELFRMIRDVQENERDIKDVDGRKKTIKSKLSVRSVDVEKALQQAAPPEIMYELLRKEFMRLTEEAESIKSMSVKIDQLTSALKETSVLVDSLDGNLLTLLKEAGVETEEDFYNSYDVHQDANRLKEQIDDLKMQITANGDFHLGNNATDGELTEKVAGVENELSEIEKNSTELITERATLVNKTERLLTDETLSHKIQLFEMRKAELAQLAKKWAARKAVAEAITRTMTELKEKKLPEVLQHADELFRTLTGGNYNALVMNDEGIFEAVSMNGMRYPIIELSQATKEQAYISLRLALAESVLTSAPFPIIMDDPFVHFDEERLSRMIKILGSVHQHQFIYFTCHKKMKDKWMNGTLINVSEIGSEQGAVVQ